MMTGQSDRLDQLFAGEHDCIGYLFKRRWPYGFCCPFCGVLQKDLAPAASVVCGYCRRQTSVTARTMLHRTRKSLLSWMRIGWLFCCSDRGISAREVQHVMALSSYQSAWNWLQKYRQAASVVESAPISNRSIVLVDCTFLLRAVASKTGPVQLLTIIEFDQSMENVLRLRFLVVQQPETSIAHDLAGDGCVAAIESMISENTSLLLPSDADDWAGCLHDSYNCLQASPAQTIYARECTGNLEQWLMGLYRGAIENKYLQGYIDEYTFRWNRRFYKDRLQMFDELTTALITPLSGSQRCQESSFDRQGYKS